MDLRIVVHQSLIIQPSKSVWTPPYRSRSRRVFERLPLFCQELLLHAFVPLLRDASVTSLIPQCVILIRFCSRSYADLLLHPQRSAFILKSVAFTHSLCPAAKSVQSKCKRCDHYSEAPVGTVEERRYGTTLLITNLLCPVFWTRPVVHALSCSILPPCQQTFQGCDFIIRKKPSSDNSLYRPSSTKSCGSKPS